MKLGWKQIEPFVKAPDPQARVILVYGPDNGLMRERAQAIGRSVVADLNDPFNAATLSTAMLLEDPARLADEAKAMSMMGGARLIRIEDAGDKIAPLIKDYLQDPSAHNLVVLEAGELGPRSPLRALAEKANNAAAVPCYVDDERGVAQLARGLLDAEGYGIAADAVSWLAAAIAGDRGRVRSEIEKLILYMGAEKRIGLADVQACCGEAGAQSFDMLVYSTGGGNIAAALKAYEALSEEGVPAVAVLRALQGHFRRLHLVKARMAEGEGFKDALKALAPPLFFKLEDPFREQVQRWSLAGLEQVMERLAQLEAETKRTGAPAGTLCGQAILAIGRRAA